MLSLMYMDGLKLSNGATAVEDDFGTPNPLIRLYDNLLQWKCS